MWSCVGSSALSSLGQGIKQKQPGDLGTTKPKDRSKGMKGMLDWRPPPLHLSLSIRATGRAASHLESVFLSTLILIEPLLHTQNIHLGTHNAHSCMHMAVPRDQTT